MSRGKAIPHVFFTFLRAAADVLVRSSGPSPEKRKVQKLILVPVLVSLRPSSSLMTIPNAFARDQSHVASEIHLL
jgi:hypothetical protein